MSRSGHEQPQAERLDFIDLTYRVDRGPESSGVGRIKVLAPKTVRLFGPTMTA